MAAPRIHIRANTNTRKDADGNYLFANIEITPGQAIVGEGGFGIIFAISKFQEKITADAPHGNFVDSGFGKAFVDIAKPANQFICKKCTPKDRDAHLNELKAMKELGLMVPNGDGPITDERFHQRCCMLLTSGYETIVEGKPSYYYIYEKYGNDVGKSFDTLSMTDWMQLFLDVNTAFLYIHEERWIHNDVKAANICIKTYGEHKRFVLIDFGCAEQYLRRQEDLRRKDDYWVTQRKTPTYYRVKLAHNLGICSDRVQGNLGTYRGDFEMLCVVMFAAAYQWYLTNLRHLFFGKEYLDKIMHSGQFVPYAWETSKKDNKSLVLYREDMGNDIQYCKDHPKEEIKSKAWHRHIDFFDFELVNSSQDDATTKSERVVNAVFSFNGRIPDKPMDRDMQLLRRFLCTALQARYEMMPQGKPTAGICTLAEEILSQMREPVKKPHVFQISDVYTRGLDKSPPQTYQSGLTKTKFMRMKEVQQRVELPTTSKPVAVPRAKKSKEISDVAKAQRAQDKRRALALQANIAIERWGADRTADTPKPSKRQQQPKIVQEEEQDTSRTDVDEAAAAAAEKMVEDIQMYGGGALVRDKRGHSMTPDEQSKKKAGILRESKEPEWDSNTRAFVPHNQGAANIGYFPGLPFRERRWPPRDPRITPGAPAEEIQADWWHDATYPLYTAIYGGTPKIRENARAMMGGGMVEHDPKLGYVYGPEGRPSGPHAISVLAERFRETAFYKQQQADESANLSGIHRRMEVDDTQKYEDTEDVSQSPVNPARKDRTEIDLTFDSDSDAD